MQADELSPRDLEVLELLARGATDARIAARFGISEQTVESRVKEILEKLGVGDRTEAALHYLRRHGAPPAGPGARNEHSAEVIGTSQGNCVLVRLEDGHTMEIPLIDEIHDRFEVGSPVLVYLDHEGNLLGCYLPDAGIGLDMRQDPDPRSG
jgi:DNA-binding CsgD family transcriptional regulator